MDYTVSAANLPFVAKFLQCLARVGDRLHFQPTKEALTIRIVNPARSAFVYLCIHRRFFLSVEEDEASCGDYLVSSKAMAIPFTNRRLSDQSLLTHLSFTKNSLVRIKFDQPCGTGHQQFTVYGQEMQGEKEVLQAVYSKEYNWHAQIQVRLLLMAVRSCSSHPLAELEIRVEGDHATFFGGQGKAKSKCTLPAGTFKTFDVTKRIVNRLTISARELKPWLSCVCQLQPGWIISIYATEPGNPIIFSIDTDPDTVFDLVLATVEEFDGVDMPEDCSIAGEMKFAETESDEEHSLLGTTLIEAEDSNMEHEQPLDLEYVRALFDLDRKQQEKRTQADEVLVPDSDADE